MLKKYAQRVLEMDSSDEKCRKLLQKIEDKAKAFCLSSHFLFPLVCDFVIDFGSFLESANMSEWLKATGIDKLFTLGRNIKKLGGIRAAVKQRYLIDQTRVGDLVGQDKFGNKYYKNDSYFMPRNRWVEYPEKVWLDYDASQVPPEWHRWLHHMTDEPPTEKPPVDHKWILEHRENTSIYLDEKYIPYSTTRPKITGWNPGQKNE